MPPTSGPPPRASVGLPPPLPPMAGSMAFMTSPALTPRPTAASLAATTAATRPSTSAASRATQSGRRARTSSASVSSSSAVSTCGEPATTATPPVSTAPATSSAARSRRSPLSAALSFFSRSCTCSASFSTVAGTRSGRTLSSAARPSHSCSRPAVVLDGRGRGDGLDAPRVGADRLAGRDLEQADLRGGRDVRAAAQLAAEVVDLEHAHELAVLLLELADARRSRRRTRGWSRTVAPGGSR